MVLWPLVVFFIVALVVPAGMIGLSYVLGQRHSEHSTGTPYEAGIVSEGSAEARFSIKFYLIAMFFVVFDLEAVFILSWAVAAREVGWAGYLEILFFTVILVATLVYLWRLGALDWGPKTKRKSS
jgi:NADH-quinone oxidoreductase subunit A